MEISESMALQSREDLVTKQSDDMGFAQKAGIGLVRKADDWYRTPTSRGSERVKDSTHLAQEIVSRRALVLNRQEPVESLTRLLPQAVL